MYELEFARFRRNKPQEIKLRNSTKYWALFRNFVSGSQVVVFVQVRIRGASDRTCNIKVPLKKSNLSTSYIMSLVLFRMIRRYRLDIMSFSYANGYLEPFKGGFGGLHRLQDRDTLHIVNQMWP